LSKSQSAYQKKVDAKVYTGNIFDISWDIVNPT